MLDFLEITSLLYYSYQHGQQVHSGGRGEAQAAEARARPLPAGRRKDDGGVSSDAERPGKRQEGRQGFDPEEAGGGAWRGAQGADEGGGRRISGANGRGPKKAILYARVSTEEQAKSGYSLAQQLEALRGYAKREGYEVVEEVLDSGQSGASLARPGMDRVRGLVATGSVSLVLAQDRDRFAREPAYHYLLRQKFEEHGTRMCALNDRGDGSPEGELTDGLLDQLAKFERAKTAKRTRRGKLRKAREGKVVGTHAPRYGFKFNATKDAYEVNEAEMEVVRRIFHMIGAEGYSLRAVAKKLEQERIDTPKRAKH